MTLKLRIQTMLGLLILVLTVLGPLSRTAAASTTTPPSSAVEHIADGPGLDKECVKQNMEVIARRIGFPYWYRAVYDFLMAPEWAMAGALPWQRKAILIARVVWAGPLAVGIVQDCYRSR